MEKIVISFNHRSDSGIQSVIVSENSNFTGELLLQIAFVSEESALDNSVNFNNRVHNLEAQGLQVDLGVELNGKIFQIEGNLSFAINQMKILRIIDAEISSSILAALEQAEKILKEQADKSRVQSGVASAAKARLFNTARLPEDELMRGFHQCHGRRDLSLSQLERAEQTEKFIKSTLRQAVRSR